MSILVELMMSGPLRVEELRRRCDKVSKRTFYIALQQAENSGLVTRIRKSRKNVVVELNPSQPEAKKARELYGSLQTSLSEQYSKQENEFNDTLQAAYKAKDWKRLRHVVFKQASLLAISSVAFALLEGQFTHPSDSFHLRFHQEIDAYVMRRQKQIIHESIAKYGEKVSYLLQVWLANHAKEIGLKYRLLLRLGDLLKQAPE
jgi:DNA-binding HxlR family transcriptional regulator